jgi:hypothetical protein
VQLHQILPSHLASQKGLDHAGEPTGVVLGWIHILPLDSPSHIVEKAGGGAGFETYIRYQPLSTNRHRPRSHGWLPTLTSTSSMPQTNSCSLWPRCRHSRPYSLSRHTDHYTDIAAVDKVSERLLVLEFVFMCSIGNIYSAPFTSTGGHKLRT